ncbi:MAG TPA: hypothetical protein PKI83_04810, partial [Bacteroidales bacterium]|nr:hypothetical protein [Bacteroidales bacterium]
LNKKRPLRAPKVCTFHLQYTGLTKYVKNIFYCQVLSGKRIINNEKCIGDKIIFTIVSSYGEWRSSTSSMKGKREAIFLLPLFF